MRERRNHAAHDKNESQTAKAALHSSPVICDVLSHRKTEPNHAGVNYAIDDAVELILLPEEQHKKNESLGALFDNWSRDHGAKIFTGAHVVGCRSDDDLIGSIENESEEHCDRSTPKEGRGQHPHWLRFGAIKPQQKHNIDRHPPRVPNT